MFETQGWRGALEQVRRAQTAAGRRQSGRYSIEGMRLHERALRAGIRPALTLLSDPFRQSPDPRIQQLLAQLSPHTCHVLPQPEMEALTHGRGLGEIISLLPLPAPRRLAECLTAVARPLLLVAVDVVDPGNVGAMIRTGHANGITAFAAVGASDPFHPKAVRTSMGSLFKTAVCRYPATAPLLAELRQAGLQTVGTGAGDGVTLPEAPFAAAGTAVFMGNEYHGLPPALLAGLDTLVTIPMAQGIDSISVNAATAVMLYEIRRRMRTVT